jgi:hypothetical protein
LSAIAVVLAGVAMLKSVRFTKTGGYAAIAVGVLSVIPANAGTIGLVFSVLALVPTAIWLGFIARDFARAASERTTGSATA